MKRNPFSYIEQFVGTEWIEEKINIYNERLKNSFSEGFLPFDTILQTHPIISYWNKYVYKRFNPMKLLLSEQALLDHTAAEVHRMLHLGILIEKTVPHLNGREKEEIRSRIINTDQFLSCLFELSVLGNYIQKGYDFHIILDKGNQGKIADFQGEISKVPVVIECKRLSMQSKENIVRNKIWKKLSNALVKIIQKNKLNGLLILEYFRKPLENDIELLSDLLETEIKKEGSVIIAKGIRIRLNFLYEMSKKSVASISWSGQKFDFLQIEGEMFSKNSNLKSQDIIAIGIFGLYPLDWSSGIINILRNARKKFSKDKYNIVYFEMASVPYNKFISEFSDVHNSINRFLERDTRRVNSVSLSVYGISPPKDGIYETVHATKFFNNPNPYLKPNMCVDLPSIEWPNPKVRLRNQKK